MTDQPGTWSAPVIKATVPVPAAATEEHTHYTDRATRLCAEGDHDSAVMWDRDAERVKIRENEIPEWREREKLFESREANLDLLWKRGVIDEQRHHELRVQLREEFGYDQGEPAQNEMATMAEEPIENRLRRAWLNGFKEGVDRSAYAATEATGRWDY